MPNQILCDTHIAKQGLHLITEAVDIEKKKGNPKAIGVLEGPCSDFSIATRNDNLYVRKLWENVISSDYVKEALSTKTLFGEIDHPEERLEISMQEAAINCTRLWIDESQNVLMGTFDILPTEKGKLLKSICDYGSTVGVSSRGVGDLEPTQDGKNKVNEDSYLFVCFDAVVQPAAIKARQKYTALTESEKKKADSILDTLVESVNNASDETGIKFIEGLAERLSLKENQQFKKVCLNRRKGLKLDENYNIIKKNERLKTDLEEAYRKINVLESQGEKNNVAADLSYLRAQTSSIKSLLETSQNSILLDHKKVLDENSVLGEKAMTLGKELKASQSSNSKLTAQVTSLTEQAKELNNQIILKENTIVELQKKVDYTVQFVNKVKQSYKMMESTIASLETEVAEAKTLAESAEKDRDLYKTKLTESSNKERNTQRLLESLQNEYLELKAEDFGIDLSSARGKMAQVKSLKDIDLIITESLRNTKKSAPVARPSVMSALQESAAPVQKPAQTDEDTSVVRMAFQQFKNK